MYLEQIPYALNSVPDIQPGVNGIALNENARCAEAVEQAYVFFAELGPHVTDLGPKQRNALTTGTAWKPEPSVAGFGVRYVGSTGYLSAAGHQLRPWSRECLFVCRVINAARSISAITDTPGAGTYDRGLFTGSNSSDKLCARVDDGATKTLVGGTGLLVGRVYHAMVTCSDSLFSLYLDGSLETSVAVSNAGLQSFTAPKLVFGYGLAIAPTLVGEHTLLWHVEYNQALTADEVRRTRCA